MKNLPGISDILSDIAELQFSGPDHPTPDYIVAPRLRANILNLYAHIEQLHGDIRELQDKCPLNKCPLKPPSL